MKIIILSLLLLAVFGFRPVDHQNNIGLNAIPIENQQEGWFEKQILDHFDTKQPSTYWRQRYFVFDEFYDKTTGPLFLYICGESECQGISKGRSYTAKLAEKYSGIAISVEHRFYGQSMPLGQTNEAYSTKNLQYLTHQQALADLAVFIKFAKDNAIGGISQETPIITIGGSYPGALSAWFRYKYRHLTLGSLASSAIVQGILDFENYDRQIGISTTYFGDYCPNDIRKLNTYVARQLSLPSTNQQLKQQFNATQLTDDEFLEMFADIFSGQVQYGHTENLCEHVLKGKSIQQQLQGLNKLKQDPETYTVTYQSNPEYDRGKNMRQWMYQCCSAMGWFQTAYKKDPLRDRRQNLDYFLKKCGDSFGQGYAPDVPITNTIMGSDKMVVDNIIFTNGVEDPWQWASIKKPVAPMKGYISECVGCGHCQELHTPQPNDPVELKYVRTQIEKNFDMWLAQYRKKIYGDKFHSMKFAQKEWSYDQDVQEYIQQTESTNNVVEEKLRQKMK